MGVAGTWVRAAVTSALGTTKNQRSVITTELADTGSADQLVWVGRDASSAFIKTILAPFDPTLAALIGGSLVVAATGVPTITVAGLAAGTTATISGSFTGCDYHGEFNITSGGTGITTGDVATVTFANAMPNANYRVLVAPKSVNTANIRPYESGRATGNFKIGFGVAPTSGQTYALGFVVIGRTV